MDRIAHHLKKGDSVKYVLRWYGYTPAEDIVQSPAHISEGFHHTLLATGAKTICKVRRREKKIGNDKERTLPTVYASGLMTIH